MAHHRSWVAPLVSAVLFALTLGLLWQPVAAAVARGDSVNDVTKTFVLPDQLSYMVMARNAADGQSVHREPFTETGSSLYAGGHMWLVGKVASAFGLTPVGAWNVAGFLLSVLLLAAFGGWVVWATGSRWGWLGASVPVLVGLLASGWHVDVAPHSHAVLWPAYAILYAGGPETPALLLGFVALVLTGWAVREHPGRLAAAGGAGLAAGLCLAVHTYVAMFAVTTCAAMLALAGFDRLDRRGRCLAAGAVLVATGLAFVVLPPDQPVARLAAVVAVALSAAAVLGRGAGGWRAAAAFAAGAAVGAGPQLARIAAAAFRGDDFLRLRQQASGDLSVPPLPVLICCAPILLLAACALLRPADGDGRYPGRSRDLLRGVFVAGLLLTFNNVWGLNQEPYRFLPYATLFLAVAAFPSLLRPMGPGYWRTARLVCVGLLVATVPSTLQFVFQVSGQTVRLARDQREVYAAIAAHAPPGTLVLVDSCIPAAVFKLATGAPVASYNPGIAFPAHVEAIRAILADQAAGRVPEASVLQRAGVSLIVKDPSCGRSGSASEYVAAFGPPVGTVQGGAGMARYQVPGRLTTGTTAESLLLFRVA